MKTPNVIYLQQCGTCKDNECEKCNFDELNEVTWSKDKVFESDTAYFSENAVRKEIEETLKKIGAYGKCIRGRGFTLDRRLINAINNLKKSANEEYRIVGSVLNGSRN